MAIRDTPQTQEAQRKVAPNVVGRRRPFRVRGEGVTIPTSGTSAGDRFLSRRVSEATDERQEYEGLLKSTFSNKLRDLNNKSLEKVMVSEGVTSRKEWAKAQEHRQKELEELTFGFSADEKALIDPIAEKYTVDFMGTGSRHVANEMHKAGIKEYQKDLAGDQDDSIRKSGVYIGQGGRKSDFYRKMMDFHNNKGEVFATMARLAKMKGDPLSAIKERKKALMTDTVVKSIEYNLGNGNYDNAKAIFDDMKDFIDPEVHDEIQAKLARGEELKEEDMSLYIVNQAEAISKGDPKKFNAYLKKVVGSDAGLNKKVQEQVRILESRKKIERDYRKGAIQGQMFDTVFSNFKNNVPFTTTVRQLDAGMDSGNAPDNRTFSHGDRVAQINFAKKVYENKLEKTDPRKYSDLMYESMNAPSKFAGRNLRDPEVVKGLDYETIQYLQREQDKVKTRQRKPPPDYMWESIKDRMDEIAEFLPEEQRFDFLTENYENIQELLKDGKFDANAMKGMMRKFDQFDAAEKPWWWNRMADAYVPGYETQAMQEYRSQLKNKDFSYYPNIELLKKFEGEETAAKIMMNMQKRHLQRQRAAGIPNPQRISTKQLNELLSTYITKKGYRGK